MAHPYTLMVWSDVHAGSALAVCPPSVPLDDGGFYQSSDLQKELHRAWRNGLDRAEEIWNKNGRGPLGLMFNGDCVEGDHHGTQQLISRDIGTHKAAFRELADDALSLGCDHLWITRGTEAHVGKSGGYEESIAKGLAGEGFPVQVDTDTGKYTSWHWRLRLNGQLISAAHHGRMGKRPWTRGSNLELLSKHISVDHLERGEEPPALCIRSHFHTFLASAKPHPLRRGTQVVATPAWQIHTSHAHKVVTEELADLGLVVFTITTEEIRTHPILFEPRRATEWKP